MADTEIAQIVHRVVQQAFGLREDRAAETLFGSGESNATPQTKQTENSPTGFLPRPKQQTTGKSNTKETIPGFREPNTLPETKRAESSSVPDRNVAAEDQTAKKTIAIGADHGGFVLKSILKDDLAAAGYVITDVGTHSPEAVDYPDYAHAVAKLVASGQAWRGIVIDGAGIGSCMVANKVPGIRAGLAYDLSSASNSREHNDANVLTLGAGLIGTNLAKQIVQTWLTTEFGGGRHLRRVDKITAIDCEHRK
jgi:ribose 5-phosphate isomerase B